MDTGGDVGVPAEPTTEDRVSEVAKDAVPVGQLPPKDHEAIEGEGKKTLVQLKQFYGTWILRIMAAQLVVVNAVFVAYARAGYDWKPPPRVVEVWLGATFVQIVSVVIGITRSLFPSDSADDDD